MLDLTGIKVIVEKSLIEYICDMYPNWSYVTFIQHDDKIVDVAIEEVVQHNYNTLEDLNSETEACLEISEFDPVEDKILSKYFKIYCTQ